MPHNSARTQPLANWFRGMGPTLARDVPFSAIYWLGYEEAKVRIVLPQASGDGLYTLLHSFVCGAGAGIVAASLPELGAGGSWSTCANGCRLSPPQDVAHVQFRSRIAFKLVWVPDDYSRFLLVDDDGRLLATGAPTGRLPALEERQANYAMVAGSKYGSEAAQMARKEV